MATSPEGRHQRLMECFRRVKQQTEPPRGSEAAALREHHHFVINEEDAARLGGSWEERMAIKYYNKLYKEYALADMSRAREGKVGLRWRTEREVITGKGQFECGNLRCKDRDGLHSYELNFTYKERGERRTELVKVRFCARCARKLPYQDHRGKQRSLKKLARDLHQRRAAAEPTGRCPDPVEDEDVEGSRPRSERTKQGHKEEPSEQGTAAPSAPSGDSGDSGPGSVWLGEMPKEKTVQSEMNDYFAGLFP